MSLRLYTSWFSPFARKVALALELKGLRYEAIDALRRDFHSTLVSINPRAEVPVLVDGDITVVNSSDILIYLEMAYPSPAIYPLSVKDRVTARALERLHDHRFDPILVDSSYWQWAERPDEPPPGLKDAAQKDFETALTQLERELDQHRKPWPFGSPGIVECAWFPSLAAAKPLGFKIDEKKFRCVLEWLDAMREHPVFIADRKRTAEFIKALPTKNYERRRIFWSGDRMEWLMSRGFHKWFLKEIEEGRAAFPV